MRISAFAGVFAVATVAVATLPSGAHAQELLQINLQPQPATAQPLTVVAYAAPLVDLLAKPNVIEVPVEPVPPQPIKYTTVSGDSLEKIAKLHNTTWQRLYNKNTQIADPDTVVVGTEIIVPLSDEVLADRPLPQPPAPVVATQRGRSSTTVSGTIARGAVAGNTYAPGYCTWYAKNRRPDLPNNLGSAATWVARAAAQGLATGSTPRAGAIGQQGNHVVYIERVNGDGSVTVSDMNYAGLYVVTTRTVPASNFRYIY